MIDYGAFPIQMR